MRYGGLQVSEITDTFLEYHEKILRWADSDSIHPLLRICAKIIRDQALKELGGDNHELK